MNIAKEILHWCQDAKYVITCPDKHTAEYIENKWRMKTEAKKRKSEIERLKNGI